MECWAIAAFRPGWESGLSVDLWHARLAVKTLRLDQREAIAEVGEG